MSELVKYAVRGQVAVLTLDDPPANAYTHELMRQLDDAILRARFAPEVQVLVVTGAGEKFFCSGADIEMLRAADPTFKYYFCLHANETLRRLEETPKLTIAALGGHTVGGGLEIAMACDLRVARRGPAKFGLPEVKLGVLPGTGGTQRLTRLLGKAKAMQLMVEGENFDLAQAVALGLVQRVMEADSQAAFLEQVVSYAERFTTPAAAALAVGRIKRGVQAAGELPLDLGLALERELQAELFASEDAREGLAAYTDKRAPQFKAR